MEAVPELTPMMLDPHDSEGISAHLSEHGYAVIEDVASPAELATADALLWDGHLSGTLGWARNDPLTWRDSVGYSDGIMTSAAHCDAMWYVRSLPRMAAAFATAYGTEQFVAAFDAMSVNRPLSTRSPSVQQRADTTYPHGKLNPARLHTHHDQEGYGEGELICYGILPLYDMNQATGATAIVPGSHRKVKEINAWREQHGNTLEAFTTCGLTPAVLNCKAGSLVLFDTALFHSECDAEDPTGRTGHGSDQLLRAIFICSMTPTRLLARQGPHVFEARRRAYELDVCECLRVHIP